MDREQPLTAHLDELRKRLFKMLIAIGCAFMPGYFVARPTLFWILHHVGLHHHIVVLSVTEAFYTTLKIALVIALVLASPVVIYQIAAFITPGLYPHERRVLVTIVTLSPLLFLGGMIAAYLLFIPFILRIMLSFTGQGLQPLFQLTSLISFLLDFTIPFGILAELPLVVAALARMGLVSPTFLARQRRWAVMGSAAIGAMIAPPTSILGTLVIAGGMYLLFELSIAIAHWTYRGKAMDVEDAFESRD